jgi:hypothetical protein
MIDEYSGVFFSVFQHQHLHQILKNVSATIGIIVWRIDFAPTDSKS